MLDNYEVLSHNAGSTDNKANKNLHMTEIVSADNELKQACNQY